MAAPELRLTVVVSPTAAGELADIWQWNADRYGEPHADQYLAFLRGVIQQLPQLYVRGRAVTGLPQFRYLLIRRGSKGHGHIAVFRIVEAQIDVVHVFHSAQDWQGRLSSEQPVT